MITTKNKIKHKEDVSITISNKLQRYRVPSSLIYDLFENKFQNVERKTILSILKK